MPLPFLAVSLSPPLRTSLALPSSPSALVAWALYLVCGSQCDFTPAITDIFKDGEIGVGEGVWCSHYSGANYPLANTVIPDLEDRTSNLDFST